MSKMKKLAGMMLAMVMALAMSVTAFAAGTTYTITINNEDSGYKYVAYQIFKGDVSTDSDGNQVLTNIEWGDGIDYTNQDLQDALDAEYQTHAAAEIAEQIESQADAVTFAKIVNGYLLTTGTEASYNETDKNYTISGLEAGYYLVMNTDVPAGSAYSSDLMIDVTEDTAVHPKAETPSSDKTVDDINDSTESSATTSSSDSADYDIGDQVPFTLTATLPGNYGSYDTYKLIFHDVMDAGLTFNKNSVVVSVTTGSVTTVVSGGYVLDYDATDDRADGCTFEVQFEDTNKLTDESGNTITVTAGSVITVNYTAELNENAVIGNPGNKNSSYIEYSNRPDWNGEGVPTGETPPDTVVVFTYKLTVNKVEEDENGDKIPLDGAGFTLYKYDVDATGNDKWVAVGSEITNATTFTWKGLDDGKYMLVETTVPNGYNKMDNLYFTVEAVHSEDGITSLVVKDESGNVISGTNLTFTDSASNGEISSDIENTKGTNLPETGGIGTTIFYVLGTILVLGTAVVLITRKRMSRLG